jgi:hypothetical protein
MLKEVLSFLTHYKSASEMVCYDTKPTLHLVAPLQHRLSSTVCAAKEDDSTFIRAMKSKGRTALESKVRLDTRHDVVAFLNPCMKGLCFLTPAGKGSAIESTRQLLQELEELEGRQEIMDNRQTTVESISTAEEVKF